MAAATAVATPAPQPSVPAPSITGGGGGVSSLWQDVLHDVIAGVDTLSNLLAIGDITGSGDAKVVLGQLGPRGQGGELRVYSGANRLHETMLLDTPSGLAVFRQTEEGKVPALAVACGEWLYVFKSMKPHMNFRVPATDAEEAEREAWAAARASENGVSKLHEMLKPLQKASVHLTPMSLAFLAATDAAREGVFAELKDQPVVHPSLITVVATINQKTSDKDAVSCPVLGTSTGHLYVLSAGGLTQLMKIRVKGAICAIATDGILEVDHRILVATREKCIHTIKGGKLSSVIELQAMPLGLQRLGKSILVACSDSTLYCYSTKGKSVWQARQPAPITAIAPFKYQPKLIQGALIGLANGEVRLYNGEHLLNTLTIPNLVPTAICFGHVWRDSWVLVVTGASGTLVMKRIRRGVEFEAERIQRGPPKEQSVRINVPTKTQLYVDQAKRERENAHGMYRVFQRDLTSLQLIAARQYAKVVSKKMTSTVSVEDVQMQVSADVQGIGPHFKVNVRLQVTSRKAAKNVGIAFQWNEDMYAVERASIAIPFAVPGTAYVRSTRVTCMVEDLVSSPIKVHVYCPPQRQPASTVLVNMPVAEPVTSVR